jgi:hypothetical protein
MPVLIMAKILFRVIGERESETKSNFVLGVNPVIKLSFGVYL